MSPSGGRSRWTVLIVLLALSLGLLGLHTAGWLAPAERVAAAPIAAVQGWLAGNLREFNDLVSSLQRIGELSARVEELSKENDRLAVENVQLREELNKAAIFEKLLRYEREHTDLEYVTADVIGRDTDVNLRGLRLNRGTTDGVQIGMPVVTERGLVGRVTDAGPNWCQVLLLVDGSSAVRVRLGQSRAEGLVVGQGSTTLLMDYITQGISISSGEYVLTSTSGGNFPPGLVIGQVTNVRKSDEALFQQADVRPSVDFDRLEVVLVITNFQPVPVAAPTPGGPNR